MTAEADQTTRQVRSMAEAARAASSVLAQSSAEERNRALDAVARQIRERSASILQANERDLAEARGSAAFRDRLALDRGRIEAMAAGVEVIARLPDPLARDLGEWQRPNGLRIRRIAQPIGVIGMIYESRP